MQTLSKLLVPVLLLEIILILTMLAMLVLVAAAGLAPPANLAASSFSTKPPKAAAPEWNNFKFQIKSK